MEGLETMHKLICKECGKEFDHERKTRQYCSKTCSNRSIARTREEDRAKLKRYIFLSCGAGVQSTAIAIMIEQGKIERPDVVLMADCGWEKQSTWDYVHSVIIPRLNNVGVDFKIVKTTDYYSNELFDNRGYLVLPAFRVTEDEKIRFKTRCSGVWKNKTIMRWLREQGVKSCECWLGISTDEYSRTKESGLKWYKHRYPLIEANMSRAHCLEMIRHFGWPEPNRTSCVICPMQDNGAWKQLKLNYPDDFAKAVKAEERIRSIDPDIYLHPSGIPLSKVIFNTKSHDNGKNPRWWEE
jgi:DNA-directed RNA polymerase subunit RPC12/RpoP